jgi:uncharacterized membrane protein YbhN (UPF0104 family)
LADVPKRIRRGRRHLLHLITFVASFGLALVIFAGILPKIADYSGVWATMRSLTWFEVVTLFAVNSLHTMAAWPQMVASLPGLTLPQAAVSNQACTTVANTLPGGGLLAAGVNYAMCRSWGFADPAIALSTLITFTWNTVFKLALPVVALGLLAVQGQGAGGLTVASILGLAILGLAFGLLVTMTERLGRLLGSVASFVRKLIRKPPVGDWADAAVRFRGEGARLIAARWMVLTLSTVASQLGVYIVLLLAVRDVGISSHEVTWPQVLGVFAFVRLLSALPITPGGLGIVDLGYIGGLVLAGRHQTAVPVAVFQTQATAAVLVFRAVTYGLQLPHGALAYLIWQRRRSWRESSPRRPSVASPPGEA